MACGASTIAGRPRSNSSSVRTRGGAATQMRRSERRSALAGRAGSRPAPDVRRHRRMRHAVPAAACSRSRACPRRDRAAASCSRTRDRAAPSSSSSEPPPGSNRAPLELGRSEPLQIVDHHHVGIAQTPGARRLYPLDGDAGGWQARLGRESERRGPPSSSQQHAQGASDPKRRRAGCRAPAHRRGSSLHRPGRAWESGPASSLRPARGDEAAAQPGAAAALAHRHRQVSAGRPWRARRWTARRRCLPPAPVWHRPDRRWRAAAGKAGGDRCGRAHGPSGNDGGIGGLGPTGHAGRRKAHGLKSEIQNSPRLSA